jgi:hypothetical protein
LAISSVQLIAVFCLAATLCENGGTPNVMVRLEDTFIPPIVPHPIFEANYTKVSKVQPKSWHVVVAKLHDLLARPTIDLANVIPRIVVLHNEKKAF